VGAGHGALKRAGGADRQQAGRQQEARVDGQRYRRNVVGGNGH